MRRALAAIAILALSSAAAAAAANSDAAYVIDDFDGPSALQNWQSSRATLALGPGHRRQGAVLTYKTLAEARLRPASSFPKKHDPAISLWIRFPQEVEISLLVKDSSGQELLFPINATIEQPVPGDWQYTVVPLTGIKGRLVETGLRVQARTGDAQGSVSFDDLELRDASEIFHLDPAAQIESPATESSHWTPRLGVNIHLLRDDHSLDLAHAAGFGFVRMDMQWTNVERAGRYRFAAYDALLRALNSRGMSVLWILDYGHPEHGGSVPRTPPDIAAFGRFAEAAAEHFKGRNVQWEVWNEPNETQFWAPSPNPLEYAALLREAVAAIRRADPSAQISSGGVSRIDQTFLRQAVSPGIAAGLTAIGIHPYRKTGPETVAPELAMLRDWVSHALGDRVEVWDTEWGYSSADAVHDAPSDGHKDPARQRQAGLAVRELLTTWAVGFPVAVWYDLRDDGSDAENPEHNYGLLDSTGNEKPAMVAIRTLMSRVSGRKYGGMFAVTPAGLHVMRWDGPADQMVIVWTDQPGSRHMIEYTTRNLFSTTGLTGQAVKAKERSGQARLELSDAIGPIYLMYGKPD